MSLPSDFEFYKDGALGDQLYRSASGLYVPARGTPATGKAVVVAADGIPEWTDIATQTELNAAIAAIPGATTEGISPDTQPASPNAADDEFEGAALDTAGTRRSGVTAWAWDNQGSATATLTRGRLVISCVGDGSGSYKTHNILQPLPAGDWTYEVEYRLFGLAGSFSAAGVLLRESGTDKRLVLTKGIDTSTKLQVRRMTSATVWTANPYNSTTDEALSWQTFYAKIARVSATITLSLGDGAFYTSRYSFTQTAEFTTAPNQIGLSVGPSNAETVVLTSGWFRRI